MEPKPQTLNLEPFELYTQNPEPITLPPIPITLCMFPREEIDFFIDNLMVRGHLIIVIIRWTGLAPSESELPFPGSLTSSFLVQERRRRDAFRRGEDPSAGREILAAPSAFAGTAVVRCDVAAPAITWAKLLGNGLENVTFTWRQL
jgi:hypothetical protein